MRLIHLAGVALLALGGCTNAQLVRRIEQLEQKVHLLTESVALARREVSDGLNMALCTPELRQLLDDVQKECTPGTAVSDNEPEMCTTKQIRGAVVAADPDHKGRFLKLMSHVRHEVFYFREGANDLVPLREERLTRLAHQAILHNTRFLVVSSPEGGNDKESIRRANIIVKELVRRGVPRSLVQRWIYAYPADRKDIDRMNDLPGIGETQQLNRGVWVFRADC